MPGNSSATGRARWRFELGAGPGTSPGVGEGIVVIGRKARRLYAVDAASGRARWIHEADEPFLGSRPVVTGGAVYVGNAKGNLYAFDIAGGNGTRAYPG